MLTEQATQVYFTLYPAIDNSRSDWWAVIKTKPRWLFHSNTIITDNIAYQNDPKPNELMEIVQQVEDIGSLLNDINDGVEVDEDDDKQIEVEEDESELEDESINIESDDDIEGR